MDRDRCVLKVRGLDCPVEAAAVRAALEASPGVADLAFDLGRGTVAVAYDPSRADPEALARQVADRTGFATTAEIPPPDAHPDHAHPHHHAFGTLGRTIVAGLALAAGLALDATDQGLAAGAAYLIAVATMTVELLPRAVRAIASRRIDMNVLMVIALIGASALGQLDEAATVAFLFGVSELLESLSLDRSRRAVRRLLEIAPDRAELIEPGGTAREIEARAVRPGDRVRVRPGDRIPVDGVVALGRSSVDQKSLTGESTPIPRGIDDEVLAGTINGEGTLEIIASRPLDDAVVTRIVASVRASQAGRAPIERSIDRFASVYTPIVLALAILVMIGPPLVHILMGWPAGSDVWRRWVLQGLVLLVIACPCALVISTPVAVVAGLAASARRGVLIKGGGFLEAVGRLRVLAFDKTGTLTAGEPAVVGVEPAGGRDDDEVLRIAAALGDRGAHVLGRAIARHARALRLDVPVAHDYEAVPGLGATGRVESTSYHMGSHRFLHESGFCRDGCPTSADDHDASAAASTAVALAESEPGRWVGWLRLADRPRPEAESVVAELGRLGVRTVMLTGDNAATAAAIAGELGLVEHRASLLPEDKARAIVEIQDRFGPTGMVGDGVNDTPALAAARVSIAMGGIGSGAALDTADVVLMADDLTALPWLIRHGRRVLARINQNVALAVGSKLIVAALAVAGLATMWMAVLADVGVSLVVVANAMRLLRS
jgi:Cd2+/Zn2+-exporting ATPase